MNNTYKIDVNTPQPYFLGSLKAATILIIPQIIDVIEVIIPVASPQTKPAIIPPIIAIKRRYQNQFFIPAIL
ncbi:hypothetical protein IJU97_06500 [bacterium]|nr:hypothetical protein [bacterium]